MQINMGRIMGKVRAYNASKEGQSRMTEYIDSCRTGGRGETLAGGEIITFDAMLRAGEKMIQCLRYEASMCEPHLPESVFAHFDHLDCSHLIPLDEKGKSGKYVLYVRFDDDLSRESLENDLGYEGVRNIVALFNNGYKAGDYVYGHWNNHKPQSGSSFHEWSTDTDAFVRSRLERQGLGFIQQAVDTFNGNYGSMYQAIAVAGDDYSPATWTL